MIALIILWLVLVALTTGIYLLIFPEYHLLFGINLGVAIFVVTALLYNFKMLTSKREPHNVLQQIIMLVYAIALFVWTVYFTNTAPKEPYIDLYIGMLALTLIAALALGISHISGKVINYQEAELRAGDGKKKAFISALLESRKRLDTCMLNEHVDFDTDVMADWQRIEDRLKSIPISHFNSATQFIEDCEIRVRSISNHALEITNCENKSELAQQLSKEINELKRYVTIYKPNI